MVRQLLVPCPLPVLITLGLGLGLGLAEGLDLGGHVCHPVEQEVCDGCVAAAGEGEDVVAAHRGQRLVVVLHELVWPSETRGHGVAWGTSRGNGRGGTRVMGGRKGFDVGCGETEGRADALG